MASPDPKFFDLFAIDLQHVVSVEIRVAFHQLVPVKLNQSNLDKLRQHEQENPRAAKGLYILHHKDKPCYVGKAERSLAKRLQEHLIKLGARLNIAVKDVSFRCLYLDENWSALAHEASLIEQMGSPWNNNGFGNNDPGRKRDSTELGKTHFDRLHPINPDIALGLSPGNYTVHDALSAVKKDLPYLLRYETKIDDQSLTTADHQKTKLIVTSGDTASTLLGKAVDALGPSWQVTFLFGYVIFYQKEENFGSASCQKWKRGGQAWKTP